MESKASAEWQGGFKDGRGSVSTASGTLHGAPYSVAKRFDEKGQFNPEELIGAAHASCFTMALSLVLSQHGITAERLHTDATVTLAKVGDGFDITKVHLDLTAKIPGVDPAAFHQAAETAKANCPVSKLFKTDISLDAKLEG